jgi:hexosaminidase
MKVKPVVMASAGVAGVLICLSVARIIAEQRQIPLLVPLPARVQRSRGSFLLGPTTRIVADNASMATAEYFAERLRRSTGYPLPIDVRSEVTKSSGNIVLNSDTAKSDLEPESYELSASPGGVVVRAADRSGMFYGVQSLLELLPPASLGSKPVSGATCRIPGVEIQDKPRFAWRGFMLDVSRHFFSKKEIEEVLDLMALHKLNTFHWHLTDDQGWRIEIRKYPRLVEVGAWRRSIGFGLDPRSSTAYGPDGRYGGYYSQADVREIVAYAQSRHITIVPEIEMPGHSTAGLSAYPEFACPVVDRDGRLKAPDVYCAGNDKTFAFLEDVLTEICDLFPGKYIHIGGDEVSKRRWRECPLCEERIAHESLKNVEGLQNYFVKRIAGFLQSKDRSVIGWTEIAEGGLPDRTMVMDWLGKAAEIAGEGHDVVQCLNTYCYFDYYQSRERSGEPPASGAYLSLERVYSFEPIPEGLAPQHQVHILGTQANLWTEYIPSLTQAEYMMFPRLCALAEVAWSPRPEHAWSGFRRRLETHCKRLEQLGVNYRKLDLAQ